MKTLLAAAAVASALIVGATGAQAHDYRSYHGGPVTGFGLFLGIPGYAPPPVVRYRYYYPPPRPVYRSYYWAPRHHRYWYDRDRRDRWHDRDRRDRWHDGDRRDGGHWGDRH